jgi:hypothetical protein
MISIFATAWSDREASLSVSTAIRNGACSAGSGLPSTFQISSAFVGPSSSASSAQEKIAWNPSLAVTTATFL